MLGKPELRDSRKPTGSGLGRILAVVALASGLLWERSEIFRQRRETAVVEERSAHLQIELRQLLADQRLAGRGLRGAQRHLTAQLTSASEIDTEIRAWVA